MDLSVYAALTRLLGIGTVPAKGMSYCAGMAIGFVGNKLSTFESAGRSMVEPITYVALYALSLGVNIVCNEGVLRLGHAFDMLPEDRLRLVAVLFATGVTTVLNFLGMRLVTFRRGIAARRARASLHQPPSEEIAP
ncbi:MAG: GtrA family protein [Phycisphaerales bacterium]|nr:GtrA family protein [Phycisphaerales bacterium]